MKPKTGLQDFMPSGQEMNQSHSSIKYIDNYSSRKNMTTDTSISIARQYTSKHQLLHVSE